MKKKKYATSPVKDSYIMLENKAPEECTFRACTFRACDICKSPYIFDGRSTNCLWCEINKDERKTEDIILRDLMISSSSEAKTDDNI